MFRNHPLIRIAAPRAVVALALLAAAPYAVFAQDSSQEWLERCTARRQDNDELAQPAGVLALFVMPRGIAAIADFRQLFGILNDDTAGSAKAVQARIARDAH